MSYTRYYIEVKEEDGIKIVPWDTEKKLFYFIEGKRATKFLNDLRSIYSDKEFRRVRERVSRDFGEW